MSLRAIKKHIDCPGGSSDGREKTIMGSERKRYLPTALLILLSAVFCVLIYVICLQKIPSLSPFSFYYREDYWAVYLIELAGAAGPGIFLAAALTAGTKTRRRICGAMAVGCMILYGIVLYNYIIDRAKKMRNTGMNYRELGKTGFRVSEVSFGSIPILRGPVEILTPYYDMSMESALDVMEHAFECGCNLFDTAVVPEYGDAEIKLGCFLQRHRGDVLISDKARAYKGDKMKKAVETSLHNLKTDCCDIYFVHQIAPENENTAFECDGALDVLTSYREKGYIRAVGVATHHYQTAYRAARDERVDVIQIPGNVLERGILDQISENRSIFENVGVIVHKAFAAGVLTKYFSVEELLNFALSYPIASVLAGVAQHDQVEKAFRKTEREKAVGLEEVLKRIGSDYTPVPCTRCQKCRCPYGVEIESVFRYYNYYHLGHDVWAKNRLECMSDRIAGLCETCTDHLCEHMCEQKIKTGLEIKRIMENGGVG